MSFFTINIKKWIIINGHPFRKILKLTIRIFWSFETFEKIPQIFLKNSYLTFHKINIDYRYSIDNIIKKLLIVHRPIAYRHIARHHFRVGIRLFICTQFTLNSDSFRYRTHYIEFSDDWVHHPIGNDQKVTQFRIGFRVSKNYEFEFSSS